MNLNNYKYNLNNIKIHKYHNNKYLYKSKLQLNEIIS